MPARHFRNRTANTVLVIPTRARKYRTALYIFDLVLTWLGLTCIAMACVMFVLASQTFFPSWMVALLLALGIIVIIVGFLGGRGAQVAFRKLRNGEYNFWLIVVMYCTYISNILFLKSINKKQNIQLTIISGVLLLVEVSGITWITIQSGIINEGTSTATEEYTSKLEVILKNEISRNEDIWWDFQKRFECCGYENSTIPDPLATGKFCTTDENTSADGCKSKLWGQIESQIFYVIGFLVVFLSMQMIICVSSLCLGFLIHPQEPIYREDVE